MRKFISLFVFVPFALLAASKPAFISDTVSKGTMAEISADITGAATLALVVDDAGDGYGCDWADWIDPVLVGPQGEVKLSTLTWKSASTGHGAVNVDKNAGGAPMKVGDAAVHGIGTHANSVIEYDIAGKGFTRFTAKGGIDRGGSDQGCGSTVKFAVYGLKADEKIPAAAAAPNKTGGLPPEETLASLTVPEGLEVSLFASEPMFSNPTDIDVDSKGRVWVCEGVNYRGHQNNIPEGDRIMILEDTDGDGRADKSTVFYQGKDIDAALGICVLGNKVIVSRAPDVFCFYDDNGDGKADRKEKIFTGIHGVQHDHSVHAFSFGPDGKLYFNMGNAGEELHTPDGKLVVDVAGNEVNGAGKPYRQGLVFRCDQDFSHVETLAWNFRNNYEVCVDSFGTLWQSDNDDDGNKGVRINYVMEYGNYGYVDEKTGAGWSTHRTNLEEDIPHRHWHQNDPGVVPNLLFTGAGSPTGITAYEGDLLPDIFRDQIIHCDAGPRVTRAYPVANDGAGYKAETVDLLTGKDNWYRPSDVGVMPDGSVVVADWYDPGVGGHAMGDSKPGDTKGRIYRIAPKGNRFSVPKIDLSTADGAVAALRSPNYATRYLAWTKLHDAGAAANSALKKLWADRNPRIRARALWLLANVKGQEDQWIKNAFADSDANIRIVGLRIAREQDRDILGAVKTVVRDPSPQVRRDAAIALRFQKSAEAASLWAELASQHDGKDRWYLEALGIGSDLHATASLEAWLKKTGHNWNTSEGRDIVWRSRGDQSPALLADILLDPTTTDAQKPRYLRAFDFQPASPAKDAALVRLLADTSIATEVASRLSAAGAQGNEAVIKATLDKLKGTPEFVDLIRRFGVKDRNADLFAMAMGADKTSQDGLIAAARFLIDNGQINLFADALKGDKAASAAKALGLANDIRALLLLEPLVENAALRMPAVEAMTKIETGAKKLLVLIKSEKLPADAKGAALQLLANAPWEDVKTAALKLAPNLEPARMKLPSIKELAKKSGDATKGQVLFQAICTTCHQLNGAGVNYGPGLSEIGAKFGKDGIYDAVLNPSAGISFGYETIHLKFKTGDTAIGLLASETRDEIALKSIGGAITKYSKANLASREKLKISSMPAVAASLPEESLVDLVEYLSTLKKK